jgi:multiple sugar transport system substrate-binding protein
MILVAQFLRILLGFGAPAGVSYVAVEPAEPGRGKSYRIGKEVSRLVPFLVLGLATWWTSSLRAQEPKELNLLYVGVEANIDSVRDGAKRYEEKTGVHINIDSYPQTEWRERMFTEIAAKSPHYDVWIIDVPEGALVANHSVNLLDFILNPAVADPKLLSPETFIPRLIVQSTYDPKHAWNPPMELQMPAYTWQGPVSMETFQKMKMDGLGFYGIPFHPNVLVLAYRKDYFENPDYRAQFKTKYGYDLAPPEDWKQFVDVASFFTKTINPNSPTEYGCTLMAKKHESLYCDWRTWLASYGVFEIGKDMVPSFNSEKGIEATQFYKDLMDKYKVVPQAAKTWTWDEVTTAFGSGLTAMAMNYHRMLLDPAIEQKGGQAGFALVPGERQADGKITRAPHYGSYYLALNKYANHQQSAYKFIEWLASPDVQRSFAKYQFHASRRDYYQDPAVLSKWPEYWKPFAESLEIGYSRPRLTVFRQYSETIQAEISAALLGNKTVKQALDDAACEVIDLFKQAGYYEALHVDPYAKQPQCKH